MILSLILQSPILHPSHSKILGQESERGAAYKQKTKSLLTSCRSGLDVQSSWSYLWCFFPHLTVCSMIQSDDNALLNPDFISIVQHHWILTYDHFWSGITTQRLLFCTFKQPGSFKKSSNAIKFRISLHFHTLSWNTWLLDCWVSKSQIDAYSYFSSC